MLVRQVAPRNRAERISCKLTHIALLAMALYAAGARADDAGTPMFSFSGFGTLGVAHSSEDKADFVSSTGMPDGTGHSRAWSPDLDSRIAAQVTANFTDRLTGVVQIISEQRTDNSYTPTIEWANIKYAITPDFSVRLGRIVLPVFLASDYRKVGYVNPWVRPPVEVYNLVPVSNNDGVDVMYHLRTGNVTNTIQGLYGKKTIKTVGGGIIKATDTVAVSDTLEYGALTFRTTYHQLNTAMAGGNFSFPIKLLMFGANYDPGHWFVMGEFAMIRTDMLGDSNGWYVTGGYRIKNFTPYLTYSRLKALSNPGLGFSFSPAGQQNVSTGVRWDFYKNFDLKLQYEHINLDAGSSGTLINSQPGFQPGGKVNVFSVAVDFVF